MGGVSPEGARDALDVILEVQADCRRTLGRNWVYAGDELFLVAGRDFPERAFYDGFWQEENGVGMVRLFLDAARKEMRKRVSAAPGGRLAVATGTDFAPILEGVLGEWTEAPPVKVLPVPSLFLGGGVTVAGLMAGKDLLSARDALREVDTLLLPGSCLREEEPRITLDDWDVGALGRELGLHIRVVRPSGDALVRVLAGAPARGDLERADAYDKERVRLQ